MILIHGGTTLQGGGHIKFLGEVVGVYYLKRHIFSCLLKVQSEYIQIEPYN